MTRKVSAVSFERYRASADERRKYGGNTVTRFFVKFADSTELAAVVTGFGRTPGERKTYAIQRFLMMQEGDK